MHRSFLPPSGRAGRSVLTAALAVAGALSFPSGLRADAPANLGAGLDVLVRAHLERSARPPGAGPARAAAAAILERQAQEYTNLAIARSDGSILVDILLRSGTDLESASKTIAASKARIRATTDKWRGGAVAAYVQVGEVAAIAQLPFVSAVHLAFKPLHDVGVVTSQGVAFHRIDHIPQFDGTGITIGVLSNSFASPGSPVTAAMDVATGDLPGPGNPFGNLTPVELLDDSYSGGGSNDEGRAMAQIIHDTAPKARLGFATASDGTFAFANNIRALAGDPSVPSYRPGFAAQVIVDDIFYLDSPMFQDGVIAQAVDEVATTRGVAYFSSAGNRPSTQGYFATYRNIPADDNPTAGTNINLTGVDPVLYAGGFHNFRTDGGRDIAQTIVAGGAISFQWDDPFDGPQPGPGPVFFTATGAITAAQLTAQIESPSLTAGTYYRGNFTATAGSKVDVIVTITGPRGNVLVDAQDTGTDEEIFFVPTHSGAHTITVTRFSSTLGSFQAALNEQPRLANVLTDYNILFFDPNGAYLGGGTNENISSNRPLEILNIPTGSTQCVISRRSIPPVQAQSTLIRYVMTGAAGVQEYYSYQTPITFGQNSARHAIGTAAYAFSRPFVPESFTSPGPAYIHFDAAGNRLPSVEVRQKPDVAAMDGANNTFFLNASQDSTADLDTFPNFFGTSAAAPQAAAIGALVLQAKGGPGSVTPAQMKSILQSSGHLHDLDPLFARADISLPNGGTLTITARADGTALSSSDPNVFSVSYVGPGSVASLVLDASSGSPTAGSVLGNVPGLVWDTRPPTAGGPFVLGTLRGLTSGDIVATHTNQAPAPSVAGQFFLLNLNFAAGTFTDGRGFNFGQDRDAFRNAAVGTVVMPDPGASSGGNDADQLGDGVQIPAGTIAPGGVGVTVTMNDGSTATGRFVNRLGKGYSPVDGYGLINAEAAVSAPLPRPISR